MHWLLGCLLATALGTVVGAQDDQRDRLTRSDGSVLTGRLLDPFASPVWTVLQGGKRIRIDRSEVQATDTVADRLAAFAARRLMMQNAPKGQQYLIDQAARDGLPGIARLQAMWVVLHDDDNEHGHQFLGHRSGKHGWLWEHEGRWRTRAELERALPQQPMRLVGERFAVTAKADLLAAVATLLDLELLGVAFRARFGQDLGLREVLAPIAVDLHRDATVFPKWGFRPMPYYVPAPHGDIARTFFPAPTALRPERLFFVGTQGLLYHMLIGEGNRQDDRDRACAWLEIGLGMQMELSMQGPPGFAVDGPLRTADLQALEAQNRDYRLTHLLHLPMYSGFYLRDDTRTAVHWSTATMLTHWLLLTDNQPATREPFLHFCREALGNRVGDSSTAFDRLLGRTIEELEAPFQTYLQQAVALRGN